MTVLLFCLVILLSALVWLLIKEVRNTNIRVNGVESRSVQANGDLTCLTQRVIMLEELLAGPPAHEHV